MSGRMHNGEARTVPCPHCRQPALYSSGNPWRPFCSERCRAGDLGDWAQERFRMAVKAPTGDDSLPEGP